MAGMAESRQQRRARDREEAKAARRSLPPGAPRPGPAASAVGGVGGEEPVTGRAGRGPQGGSAGTGDSGTGASGLARGAAGAAATRRGSQSHEGPLREPWNKGLALTPSPSLSTARRWMEAGVAEGIVEREVAEPDGKPGRPPVLYRLSESGRRRAAANPPLPLDVQAEITRRQQNARNRRGQQRRARAVNAAGMAVATARRRLKVAEDAAARAKEALARSQMVIDALKALSDAGGDFSALLPEEVEVLTETGCVVKDGGRLVPAPDWAEKADQVVRDSEMAEAWRAEAARTPAP